MAYIDFKNRYRDQDGFVAVLQAEEGAAVIDELRYAVRIANNEMYCRSEIIINNIKMVVKPDDDYVKLAQEFKKKVQNK